jgi:hypothetical protein
VGTAAAAGVAVAPTAAAMPVTTAARVPRVVGFMSGTVPFGMLGRMLGSTSVPRNEPEFGFSSQFPRVQQ